MKAILMTLFILSTGAAQASRARYSLITVKKGPLYRGNVLTLYVCQRSESQKRKKNFRDCGDQKNQEIRGKKLYKRPLRGLLATNTIFKDIDFKIVNAEFAHMKKARFIDSNILDSSLLGANLGEATFVNTDLKDTQLCGAYLVGADLRGAKNLEKANLKGAIISNKTKLPFSIEKAESLGMKIVPNEIKGYEAFTFLHVANSCNFYGMKIKEYAQLR